MSGTTFFDVYSVLSRNKGLEKTFTISKAITYVRLATALKRAIIHAQPPSYDPSVPPISLPPNLAEFLQGSVGIKEEDMDTIWTAFRMVAWNLDLSQQSVIGDGMLYVKAGQGMTLRTGNRTLYPPVTKCVNTQCPGTDKILRAGDRAERKIVLYTLKDGACATYHMQLRCLHCHTVYHNNYYVVGSHRHYYSGVPEVIDIGKHHFIERDVAALFLNLMLVSWTSVTNAAEIYNRSLMKKENQPDEWDFVFDIRAEHIWNAIAHLAILEDCEEHGTLLTVTNKEEQKDRLSEAISARNKRFENFGQPEWAHFYERCVRLLKKPDGVTYKASAIVCDGITIGHPCCNVPNCMIPLADCKKDRFCKNHTSRNSVCAVDICEQPVQPGFKTCGEASHRELDNKQKILSAPPDEETLEELVANDMAPDEGVEEGMCAQKKTRIKGSFGRNQTSTEMIMARPCGIIVARATSYFSESVPQTVKMLEQVFNVPGSMPDYFIYDNCCSVYNYLQARGAQKKKKDPLLSSTGFPVDAFHFDCKHKKTDTVCQEHCNPRHFKELIDEDGKWYFNSSKCEQINSWLGGYHSILREMSAERYNFLLDELLMRKNRIVKAKLEAQGHLPGYYPGLQYKAPEAEEA
ncbi:hypothetical protein DFP72DRAFT_829203 [Ephemerocybe angulata]|uniref:CxC5 like cysteine cluster associated with KDZ domain-containing protein n=1 Tax=Ephemerocybe angulata TaxID=980116 RepID=A0A8H6LVR1_9AGAR|nr:hypothetical protein DFP72DRAFT_829203 [Tulosesus angulatus]